MDEKICAEMDERIFGKEGRKEYLERKGGKNIWKGRKERIYGKEGKWVYVNRGIVRPFY